MAGLIWLWNQGEGGDPPDPAPRRLLALLGVGLLRTLPIALVMLLIMTPASASTVKQKKGAAYYDFSIAPTSPGVCGFMPLQDGDGRIEASLGAECIVSYRFARPVSDPNVQSVELIYHDTTTWQIMCASADPQVSWSYGGGNAYIAVTVDAPSDTTRKCRVQQVKVTFA